MTFSNSASTSGAARISDAASTAGADSTTCADIYCACICQKLAPAGKNSTDISAGSAAFPISVKGVFLQWKVIANKQTLPFQIFYCYSITILHWLDMLPECQFSVTERSLQTIKGAHEWAQEHGSLFLHLPAPGDQLKISCFHDHQQKIKFFFCIINWKIRISQAFNSLLARRVRFRGITNKRNKIAQHWNNQMSS